MGQVYVEYNKRTGKLFVNFPVEVRKASGVCSFGTKERSLLVGNQVALPIDCVNYVRLQYANNSTLLLEEDLKSTRDVYVSVSSLSLRSEVATVSFDVQPGKYLKLAIVYNGNQFCWANNCKVLGAIERINTAIVADIFLV